MPLFARHPFSPQLTHRRCRRHRHAVCHARQVIGLRAVVQRVEEGPAARLHPGGFTVRRVKGLRACLLANAHGGAGRYSGGGGGGGGLGPYSSAVTTTAVFPSLPLVDERAWPRCTVNKGGAAGGGGGTGSGSGGAVAPPPHHDGTGTGLGSRPWQVCSRSPLAAAVTPSPPLALNEFASVDFFIETPGCHTEADFLRLEACVDVRFSGARARSAEGVRALTVALTGGQLAASVGLGGDVRRGQWGKRWSKPPAGKGRR